MEGLWNLASCDYLSCIVGPTVLLYSIVLYYIYYSRGRGNLQALFFVYSIVILIFLFVYRSSSYPKRENRKLPAHLADPNLELEVATEDTVDTSGPAGPGRAGIKKSRSPSSASLIEALESGDEHEKVSDTSKLDHLKLVSEDEEDDDDDYEEGDDFTEDDPNRYEIKMNYLTLKSYTIKIIIKNGFMVGRLSCNLRHDGKSMILIHDDKGGFNVMSIINSLLVFVFVDFGAFAVSLTTIAL